MVIKMYSIKKLSAVAAAFIIVFSLAACPTPPATTGETGDSPYLGETLSISGQPVWKYNRYATKISKVHTPYEGNHDIGVFAYTGKNKSDIEYVGEGEIKNGFITFSVNNNDIKNSLVDWDMLCYLFDYWTLWENTEITPSDTKLNAAAFWAYPVGEDKSNGMVDRQQITGTSSTITDETILYIYAEKDCSISGGKNQGYRNGKYYYYTESSLNLSLKRGWNMICISETYGTNYNGSARFSLIIRDPIMNIENYKWILNDIR